MHAAKILDPFFSPLLSLLHSAPMLPFRNAQGSKEGGRDKRTDFSVDLSNSARIERPDRSDEFLMLNGHFPLVGDGSKRPRFHSTSSLLPSLQSAIVV